MSRFEKDLLKRQIEQLGRVVAALVLGAREDGDYETGLEAVRKRAQDALGVDHAMLSRLTPASAAMLLHDGEAVRAYAKVCAAEAELEQLAGNEDRAAALRCRALDLEAEALGLGPAAS